VPTPENEEVPGAGLGLTLTKHIITSHGGCIEVDSDLGRGSTFTLLLPLSGSASQEGQA
jgi:signal transduction histidine kinase